MRTYDFKSLSPHEFEILSRDLLQAELGVTFESFPPGPDGAVDARWVSREDPPRTIVVQCKHYARSGYDALLSAVRKEAPRARALRADRYILTTSVELADSRKKEIVRALGRPGMRPDDVVAGQDVNNLLGKFREIEHAHHKLWLTSIELLARLPMATAFLDGTQAVEGMRRKLERYVPNPSFDRALEILDKQRVCVIVGAPGVGKTTLAETLLVAHLDLGYQPVRVVRDVAELKGVPDHGQKQIFYYDDFLGSTGLDHDRGHERGELVRRLQEVEHTPHWRFVLTTRDYVLHAAQERSDPLRDYFLGRETCAIRQETYTAPLRAEILYNHLAFSDLPDAFKLEVADSRRYMAIVNHRNYNPRIVEFMTDPRHTGDVAPGGYLDAFRKALDEPWLVWETAFRRKISDAARHVLLALFTLRDSAPYDELERVFEDLHQARAARDRIECRPYDFISALRELSGNFITIEGPPGAPRVRFANPSVRDYLERHVAEVPREAVDLMQVATTTPQLSRLWTGRAGRAFPGLLRAGGQFVEQARAVAAREVREESLRRDQRLLPTPEQRLVPERRVHLALTLAEQVPGSPARDLLRLALRGFVRALEPGHVDVDAPLRVLAAAKKLDGTPGYYRRVLIARTKSWLLDDIRDLDDVERATAFALRYGAALRYEDRELVEERLEDIAGGEYYHIPDWDTSEDIESRAVILEEAATAFHAEIRWHIDQLRHLARERRRVVRAADPGPSLFDILSESGTEDAMGSVDASFASLASQLRAAPPDTAS